MKLKFDEAAWQDYYNVYTKAVFIEKKCYLLCIPAGIICALLPVKFGIVCMLLSALVVWAIYTIADYYQVAYYPACHVKDCSLELKDNRLLYRYTSRDDTMYQCIMQYDNIQSIREEVLAVHIVGLAQQNIIMFHIPKAFDNIDALLTKLKGEYNE